MGREIKFRGKYSRQHPWMYGDCYHHYDGSYHTLITNIDDKEMQSNTFSVDSSSVGQYIGLCDKNGNEIYADDVVTLWLIKGESRTKYFSGKVTDHGYAGYTIDTANDYMEFALKNYEYEVIGNIYDNPELLK